MPGLQTYSLLRAVWSEMTLPELCVDSPCCCCCWCPAPLGSIHPSGRCIEFWAQAAAQQHQHLPHAIECAYTQNCLYFVCSGA